MKYDITIIGAGIMGLFSGLYCSSGNKNVLIIDRWRIFNKKSSSYGYTRSIRNDYIDPFYANISYKSRGLWEKLNRQTNLKFMINCGVLNLSKNTITPDFKSTYSWKSYKTLEKLKLKTNLFYREQLSKNYPQFSVDRATLDVEAGLLYMPNVTKTLITKLSRKRLTILENTNIISINETSRQIIISTNKGQFKTGKLIITANIWTNEVLKLIKGAKVSLPISATRPANSTYFVPDKKYMKIFNAKKMPVFAYLDIGIYGHPYIPGKTPGVKIGYYKPAGFRTKANLKINNQVDFVKNVLPFLYGAKIVKIPEYCYYDMTPDNDFIVGRLPSYNNIFIAAGFCGTGYKFAPIIGKVLSEYAHDKKLSYNLERFSPSRFENDSNVILKK